MFSNAGGRLGHVERDVLPVGVEGEANLRAHLYLLFVQGTHSRHDYHVAALDLHGLLGGLGSRLRRRVRGGGGGG